MLIKILISGAIGAIIALIMGTYLRWLHRRYVSPLDYPNKELAGEIEQIRIVQIDCPPDKAVLAARNALLSLPKIKGLTTTGRKIVAKTGMTFRTFGENLIVTATSSDEHGAELTIESKPRFSGTTVDYGKSYENVERIVAHLESTQSVRLLSANNSFKPSPLRGLGPTGTASGGPA